MTYSLISGGSLPRIAVSFSPAHPDPHQLWRRVRFACLAASCGAESQIFYNYVPDLVSLPHQDRESVGTGIFVPALYDLDLDHFRRLVPAQVARLLAELREVLGGDDESVLARFDVRSAFTLARAMQAYGVDLACSHRFRDMSVSMFLAARLLSLPWVFLDCPGGVAQDEALFRFLLRGAALVVPGSIDEGAARVASFGAIEVDRAARPFDVDGGASASRAMRALLARPRADAAPAKGPHAAYAGQTGDPVELPAGVRPFLVLGAERTGSNLLVEALAEQPRMTCAGEIFNPRLIAERSCPWLPTDHDPEVLHRLRADGPNRLVQELLRQADTQGMTWCGFKLLYYHGVVDARVLGDLVQLPGLRIVHQVRANRLQRWLSHCRATASDSWYTARGEGRAAPAGPVLLDLHDTALDFLYQEELERRYRAVFHDRPRVEIEYEDLVARSPALLDRLGRFFDVPMGEVEVKSEKTGGGSLRAAIQNFDSLQAAFEGTRWHGYFYGA